MKKLFYIGAIALALFEFLNVYFIMPMPGSQRMQSLDLAYFLYSYRWFFRILFSAMTIAGAWSIFTSGGRKWIAALLVIVAGASIYLFNFVMSADHMFKPPVHLVFKSKTDNAVPDSSVVVGVDINGEVKAYPIRFIGYHHQVQDEVGGKKVIVTYCTVCRTGRVFEPIVKGKLENFRLVGMDHFNAMFEDETTRSWWRQVNGEAVTGSLKGEALPELESFQMTIRQLFALYPNAHVMQADDVALTDVKYDSLARYERGKSTSDLTRTDSLSWKDKSWVIGIKEGKISKAYDWLTVKKKNVVNDNVGEVPVVIVISADGKSFAAFRRPADSIQFSLRQDSLVTTHQAYGFSGAGKNGEHLVRVQAYQEFWHSWRTFHPTTEQYKE